MKAFPHRAIGHRCHAGRAPENTRAGLLVAAGLGVGAVEIDVQLSADGVPVLFHDDSLERTSTGTGLVVETMASDLARLDAGSWFGPAFAGEPILTLARFVMLLGETGIDANIEIKADDRAGPRTARVALEVASGLWPGHRPPPLVSSFSSLALAEAARIVPDWPRGLLVEDLTEPSLTLARQLGCAAIHPDAARLDPDAVARATAEGFGLCAYTVNEPDFARTLYDWGVDALFSDWPERIVGAPPSRG